MTHSHNHHGWPRLLTALLAASFAACTDLPLASLWQLRKFDFETFDPGELRVALRLPANLALRPDGLQVEIKLTREATGEQSEASFWMRERAVASMSAGLPAIVDRGQSWVVLQLDALDGERLRRFRQQLIASKSSDRQGKSRLELKADPRLCTRGGAFDTSARVSAAVRWLPEPGFVMLLQDQSFDELRASTGRPLAPMPRCEDEPKSPA